MPLALETIFSFDRLVTYLQSPDFLSVQGTLGRKKRNILLKFCEYTVSDLTELPLSPTHFVFLDLDNLLLEEEKRITLVLEGLAPLLLEAQG